MSFAMRSRAVRRFFLYCASMALAPPPWRMVSSSFLISVRRSMMRRAFFPKSGDSRLMRDSKTELDTRRPLVENDTAQMLGEPSLADRVRQYNLELRGFARGREA